MSNTFYNMIFNMGIDLGSIPSPTISVLNMPNIKVVHFTGMTICHLSANFTFLGPKNVSLSLEAK